MRALAIWKTNRLYDKLAYLYSPKIANDIKFRIKSCTCHIWQKTTDAGS